MCFDLSSSVLDDHYLNSFNAQSVLPDLWISLVHEKLGKEISVVCSHVLRASWSKSKTCCLDSIEQHINHQGEDPPALCKRVAQFPREDGRGRRGKGLCWHPVSTRNKLPWSGNSSQNQAAIVCVVQRHLQPGQVVVSMLVLQGFSHIFATQPAISDLEISHQPSLRYLCPDQAFPALPC